MLVPSIVCIDKILYKGIIFVSYKLSERTLNCLNGFILYSVHTAQIFETMCIFVFRESIEFWISL